MAPTNIGDLPQELFDKVIGCCLQMEGVGSTLNLSLTNRMYYPINLSEARSKASNRAQISTFRMQGYSDMFLLANLEWLGAFAETTKAYIAAYMPLTKFRTSVGRKYLRQHSRPYLRARVKQARRHLTRNDPYGEALTAEKLNDAHPFLPKYFTAVINHAYEASGQVPHDKVRDLHEAVLCDGKYTRSLLCSTMVLQHHMCEAMHISGRHNLDNAPACAYLAPKG